MNKSVIVYGPQGCGKTLNAPAMLKHFGLQMARDLDENVEKRLELTGVLYLTSRPLDELIAAGLCSVQNRRVHSYELAMQMVQAELDQEKWFDRDVTSDKHVRFTLKDAGRQLVGFCHTASKKAGWWYDHSMQRDLIDMMQNPQSPIEARLAKALVAEKLCLSHSELSEGMEGHRKGRMDDKLTHRPMLEVELADAVIRIADLAGALGLDLGGAIAEKMAFNAVRPDHKREAREAEGGKAY